MHYVLQILNYFFESLIIYSRKRLRFMRKTTINRKQIYSISHSSVQPFPMKTLIILSVFLLAVASASITRSPAAKLRDLLPESRIVGGSLASAGQFPYQVGLSLSDGKSSWWCGGSIIAANWIITAAHCTDG